MKPLVSIVIPTKDRSQYAVSTIQACLSIGENIQVVVADSSRDDRLPNSLNALGVLEKVTYVKTDPNFSVVDNFNSAIVLALGDYVTCIGDDDFVTSGVTAVAEYARNNQIDCVNFTFPVTYWWPDFIHRRRGTIDAATLCIEKYTGRIQSIEPTHELHRAARLLGSGPQKMPRIYAGLVSRRLLDSICAKYGQIFGGVSPDVYSSTLLARECQKPVVLDFPIVVPGISGGSTSGTSSNGKHVGTLRENSHIAPFKNLVWDERIPEFYSVPTVWSFSMLKALEKAGLVDHANFMSTYLKCFLYHRKYLRETGAALRVSVSAQSLGKTAKGVFSAIFDESAFVLRAVVRRIRGRVLPQSERRVHAISSSNDAYQAFEKILTDTGGGFAPPQ
jgi:hypothetical protein